MTNGKTIESLSRQPGMLRGNLDTAATALLYKQAGTSILGAWFTAGLAVVLLWNSAHSPFLTVWLLIYSVLMISRLYLCNQYRARSGKYGEAVVWKRLFVGLAGCSGLLWGLLVYRLFPAISLESKVIIILFAGGLTASAIASYAAVLQASLSFSLPFLLSLILIAFPDPDTFTITISGMTFLYTLVLLLTAKTINSSIISSFALQFENNDLINHLAELQKAEAALNHELQEEIEIRRATQNDLECSMRTLESAKTEAEDANRAKDRFLAVMSHEIRTPLNNIIMAAEYLEKTDLNHDIRRYVDIVTTAGNNLLTIINDILDHARISSGLLQLECLCFNLHSFLRKTCAPYEMAAKSKGIGFSFTLSTELPTTVVLDPLRLRQILLNLLDNAIKFTERGHVALTVGFKTERIDRHSLLLAISDTGIGIREDTRQMLFTPFVQADVSTTRKYGGTGLGLAICKEIIALMHGEIRVESVPGEGSTFYCSIPCEPSNISGISMNQTCLQDRAPKPGSVKGLNILLAEDDETSRVLTAELLECCGHTVKAVDNGESALAETAAGNYDLVLLDLEMPGIDGLKVISLVRASEKDKKGRGHQLIAAVTAQAFPADRLKCLNAGADGYMPKPVTEEKLQYLIDAILQGKGTDADFKYPPERLQQCSDLLWLRTKGNRAAYATAASIFIRTYPQVCMHLQLSLAENAIDEVRYAAHKLKGMLSFFDETDMYAMAQELETAAKQDDIALARSLWPQLQHETDRLCSAIHQTMGPD